MREQKSFDTGGWEGGRQGGREAGKDDIRD
jgi:hypothetical protein